MVLLHTSCHCELMRGSLQVWRLCVQTICGAGCRLVCDQHAAAVGGTAITGADGSTELYVMLADSCMTVNQLYMTVNQLHTQ